jgi:hypothetical protein
MIPIFVPAEMYSPVVQGFVWLAAAALLGAFAVVGLAARERRRQDRPPATVTSLRPRLPKAA